jgi:hypothetical protein
MREIQRLNLGPGITSIDDVIADPLPRLRAVRGILFIYLGPSSFTLAQGHSARENKNVPFFSPDAQAAEALAGEALR